MERVVTPANCALVVAVPSSHDEFVADLASPAHDFSRSVVKKSGRPAEVAWKELYVPAVIDTLRRVETRIMTLGATVVSRATPQFFREALSGFSVVALVAHSIMKPILADDILDMPKILETVDAGETIPMRHVRDALCDRRAAIGTPDELASALDGVLARTRDWFSNTAETRVTDSPGPHIDRVILENEFSGALRSSLVLELRDGLHTFDEFLAAIPEGFAGVLDLSVCNSNAFGKSIKRHRPGCLIVENAFLARVDLRLARFALAMAQLHHEPMRYTDALRRVAAGLLEI